MSRKEQDQMWRIAGLFSGLGFLLVIGYVVFFIGGMRLDRYLSTTPLFGIVGFIFASALVVLELRRVVRLSREQMKPRGEPILPSEESDNIELRNRPSGVDPLSKLAADQFSESDPNT